MWGQEPLHDLLLCVVELVTQCQAVLRAQVFGFAMVSTDVVTRSTFRFSFLRNDRKGTHVEMTNISEHGGWCFPSIPIQNKNTPKFSKCEESFTSRPRFLLRNESCKVTKVVPAELTNCELRLRDWEQNNGFACSPEEPEGREKLKKKRNQKPKRAVGWGGGWASEKQLERMGKFTSRTQTISMGVPQGCIFSPLLLSLNTNDCSSTDPSVSTLKYADDTTVIALICDGD
ncbi:hypothetical protein P4O66_002743 [Electrophorus voltai]|uniref:Reverse transcriptase domain-containing protein n=1 Tax=Electrophorus voltai TaxID=2609070 RepID=A0AAD9DPU9_9TELE|nr:hypothetical protein P4O66_002743 [Electrophorus voltai]